MLVSAPRVTLAAPPAAPQRPQHLCHGVFGDSAVTRPVAAPSHPDNAI